jgi:hypothetical protein
MGVDVTDIKTVEICRRNQKDSSMLLKVIVETLRPQKQKVLCIFDRTP